MCVYNIRDMNSRAFIHTYGKCRQFAWRGYIHMSLEMDAAFTFLSISLFDTVIR